MKNRITKLFLATTLCVAMVGTTCFAAAPPASGMDTPAGGEITGDNTVQNPIYKVVVPTILTYAIDPFEQEGQSQIYSNDLSIINKSNVNVKVDASVIVTPKPGITLKQTAAEVSEADDSKNLYFAATVPSAVVPEEAAAAAYTIALVKGGAGFIGNYYTTDTVGDAVESATATRTAAVEMVDTTAVAGTYTKAADVALAETPTKLTFALKAADYVTYFDSASDVTSTKTQYKAVKNTASAAEGSATFRFKGTVNTKAAWAVADLTAKVAYSFIGLSDVNYTALMAKQVAIDDTTKAHGYVQEAPADAAPSVANTVSTVAVGTDATWNVNLGAGTLVATGISKVTYKNATNVTKTLAAEQYTFTNGTLTIKAAYADTISAYTISFSDAAETAINVTVARP